MYRGGVDIRWSVNCMYVSSVPCCALEPSGEGAWVSPGMEAGGDRQGARRGDVPRA